MGFTPKRKLYELEWPEGSDYHGFEVTMARIPVGEFRDLLAATEAGSTVALDQLDRIYELVGSNIVEWNLEIPAGTPVPPSVDALRKQDVELLMEIIGGWFGAMTQVADPLDGRSTGGVPSVELSTIPVEPLTPLPS